MSPTQEQLQLKAKERVSRNFLYWQPYVLGLALFSEDTLRKATYIEHLLINEVCRLRNEFLENQIIRAELVQRKK